MEVRVNSRLWMRLDDLSKQAAGDLRRAFEHNNPEYFKKANMGYGVGKETPVIKTWKHVEAVSYPVGLPRAERALTYAGQVTWLTLPRGGTARLRKICGEHGIHIQWTDEMSNGNVLKCGGGYTGDWVTPQIFPKQKQIPWDHQDRMKRAILDKRQGVVRAPTGSGKTSALIDTIREANVPAIVIVWESGLLDQWQQRIQAELGIPIKHQGLIRGSTLKLRPITLAMQQTLNKWDDHKWNRLDGVFGFVGADELQRYAATTFVDTIDRFDAAIRVGVSADETRRDHKEFLIYDYFGQIIEDIPKKELEGKGIIHEVDVNIEPTTFSADWYMEADQPDFSGLLAQMIDDDDRNDAIVRVAVDRYKRGETILLFTHRVEHCHTLRLLLAKQGIPAEYMLGGTKYQDDFQNTLNRMRDLKDPLRVAIGTLGKVGVGLDIPNLTCGIACTPIHNNKQFMGQVKGRVCRRCTDSGKVAAELVFMWDQNVFGRQPLINLKRWNKHANVMHLHRYMDVDQYLKEHYAETHTSHFGPFASAESIRDR